MFDVKDLHYTYPKNHDETIRGISFSIGQGEIFGFLGPSGAGKSTTQKILIRLLDHNLGTITFDGKDIRSYGHSFYEDIGVSFEMPVHFGSVKSYMEK